MHGQLGVAEQVDLGMPADRYLNRYGSYPITRSIDLVVVRYDGSAAGGEFAAPRLDNRMTAGAGGVLKQQALDQRASIVAQLRVGQLSEQGLTDFIRLVAGQHAGDFEPEFGG